jgi:predicted  nucleic acid-binding Zn-ribbon protein
MPRFDPLGVPASIVIFWLVVGGAVGALITALVARYQFIAARREHLLHVRRRDGTVDRLKSAIKEHEARLERQGEQLRELERLKQERSALASDLDQARRSISDLQSALDAARAGAREAHLRLTAALDSERQEAAARRAAAAAELAAAQETALNLRTELASTREAASRTTARLEADLATTRSLLERTAQELDAERSAAAEGRAELARRVAALEDDRLRLETDLSTERRANAEKQTSLRSFVSTLREQYALACTERDAAAREAELHRSRADEMARRLEQAREEFGQRLDTEHEESVELISRVWDYVHNYPRLRDRPLHGPPAPPPAHEPFSATMPTPPAGLADVLGGTEPPPEHPEALAPEPAVESGPEARTRAAEPSPAAPSTPPAAVADREVPSQQNGLADVSAPREEAYDIERALSEQPPHPERHTAPTPPAGTKVRRPVSAMRRDHDVLVICDDGSVWTKRPKGWTEEKPIPGSEVEVTQRLTREAKE